MDRTRVLIACTVLLTIVAGVIGQTDNCYYYNSCDTCTSNGCYYCQSTATCFSGSNWQSCSNYASPYSSQCTTIPPPSVNTGVTILIYIFSSIGFVIFVLCVLGCACIFRRRRVRGYVLHQDHCHTPVITTVAVANPGPASYTYQATDYQQPQPQPYYQQQQQPYQQQVYAQPPPPPYTPTAQPPAAHIPNASAPPSYY